MRLWVAKSAGFCFGVKRAMDMALEAARKNPKHLYTLGPLIHNPQAVTSLERLGVKMKEEVRDIPQGTILFRSHGVSRKDLRKAKEKKLHIIDATCPIVKRAQHFAQFLDQEGYALLIVGDVKHPEVEAIRSYIDGHVDVVGDVREIKRLGPWEKLGIIAQTTQSFDLFREVAAASVERAKEVRVFNTICHATTLRQKEAREIAKKVECMVVVGGYNSGNTQRLTAVCQEVQPNTHHVEEAQELDKKWFSRKKRVGLTAGASTPHWIIKEVEQRIRTLGGTLQSPMLSRAGTDPSRKRRVHRNHLRHL